MNGSTPRLRLPHRRTPYGALLLASALWLLLLAPGSGLAFTLLFGKWDDPTPGTPAVVTWGFIAPGAGIAPIAPVAWSGTNTLGSGDPLLDPRARIDAVHGAGAFDAALERAFATWAAATNVTFVRVADSAGDFAGNVRAEAEAHVRENPGTALAIAAGIGFLLGVLTRKS